jgi:isoquinoline 1-oxidoreductase beta subunit
MSANPTTLPENLVLDRRRFIGGLGGLVLVASVSGVVKAQEAPKYGAEGMPHGTVDDPLTFVAIGEDGIVTVIVHRSEMGQGIRSGLPLIIADELEADWSRVRVKQAPGDEPKFGNQNTDGSRSVRHFFEPMRRCGAAARAMLEAAAAASWNVPVGSVRAVNHEVVHADSGRKLGFGELAKAAAKLPVPPRVSLRVKDPSQFR